MLTPTCELVDDTFGNAATTDAQAWDLLVNDNYIKEMPWQEVLGPFIDVRQLPHVPDDFFPKEFFQELDELPVTANRREEKRMQGLFNHYFTDLAGKFGSTTLYCDGSR